MPHRRLTVPIGLLVMTALIAGCGGRHEGEFHPRDDQGAGTAAPSLPSPSESRPVPGAGASSGSPAPGTPESSVLDQYRRFQQAMETAYSSNDTSGLTSVATGAVLNEATRQVRKNRAAGVFYRFHNVLNPRVARMQGGAKAYVVDCMRTLDHYKFDADTGRRIADYAPKGFTRYIAVLRSVDATWKVAEADGMDVKKC